MSAPDWVAISKAAREAAAEAIASCRRAHPGAHFVQRQVEILAIDENHERIGDPLDYLLLKECSGKRLAQVVRDHAPAQYAYICVQGGIDAFDSFQDAMAYPDDYEPMVECWDVSTADDLPGKGERIPLEESNVRTSGMTVGQRIEQQTVRQRATGTHGSQPHGEVVDLGSVGIDASGQLVDVRPPQVISAAEYHEMKRKALAALDRAARDTIGRNHG